MLKSSLFEIIRTFSKEDLVKFEDFVKSPYHNKNSNVIKLYSAICKFAPDFNDPKLAKEEAWKIIFPAKKYNYGIMKNLIHDLAKLSESYLSHENFNAGLSYDKHLIKELYNRQTYSMFFGKLEKFENKNDTGRSGSEEFFSNKIFSDNIKHEYSENRAAFQENKTEVFKNLIHYFLDHLLRFAQSVYQEEQRVNVNHDYPFIKIMMEYLKKSPELLEGSEIIKMRYYSVLCFLTDADEEIFGNLSRVFSRAKEMLSPPDKVSAYSSIMGIYEMLYRKGIMKYEKEFLILCIEYIEENIYSYTNNYTDLYSFSNVIAICMRNSDSKTLAKFINENIHRIHPDKRESMCNFALSGISFLEKDYEKAIAQYSKTNFNNFFDSNRDNCHYKISSKVRVAYSLYELNYLEEVLTEVDSSIHFINNNYLLQPVSLISYENFFRILRKITFLKLKYDGLKQRKIHDEIINLKKLSFKPWLLKKVEELEK
jgi:hypothetical protein